MKLISWQIFQDFSKYPIKILERSGVFLRSYHPDLARKFLASSVSFLKDLERDLNVFFQENVRLWKNMKEYYLQKIKNRK